MKEQNAVREGRFPTRMSMVRHLLKGAMPYFILSALSACVISVLDLANPRIIGYTVDAVIGDQAVQAPVFMRLLTGRGGGLAWLKKNLWAIACLVLVIALFRALFQYLFNYLNTRGAEKLVNTTWNSLYRHILYLPYAWHGENSTGDIIQRCTSDVETMRLFFSEQLSQLVQTILLVSLALTFMFRIHVRLAWAAFLFIPLIILYSLFFHSRIGSSFEKADMEEGKLSTVAQENLTGVRVVRAFGREACEKDRFERQNETYTNYWIHLMRTLSAFWSSGDLASYLQILVIYVLGTGCVIRGEITVGGLISFITYNAMLTWPIRALGRVIANMSKAGIAIDRLRYIMNAEEEKDRPDAVCPPMDRDIVFDHVTFSYESARETGPASEGDSASLAGAWGKNGFHAEADGRAPADGQSSKDGVLQDVSFRIPAGSVCGILGGTGSGKSTLMHLLDRLYDLPEEGGCIRIGDTDIRDMKASYLRENIGMVLQEPYLFSKTLSENIAIAAEGADMRRVRDAARIASLDDTIEHFVQGYDTFVGERGVTLSGGQKQRTAIAQMLVRRPPIMIFDDSLSAVDAETDAKIRSALREKTANRTVILISHRISTLMHADTIVVLDHGRVREQGSHVQLLEAGGLYRKIYDLQTRGAETGSQDAESSSSGTWGSQEKGRSGSADGRAAKTRTGTGRAVSGADRDRKEEG